MDVWVVLGEFDETGERFGRDLMVRLKLDGTFQVSWDAIAEVGILKNDILLTWYAAHEMIGNDLGPAASSALRTESPLSYQ